MPRLPKPTPLRQNTERRDVGLVAMDGGLVEVPEHPANWLAETREDWAAFWTSPLVGALLPVTDTAVVRRLFGLRDERARMMTVIRRARIVPGAKGQPRANPLYAQVGALDSAITTLEDRIGLSPRARLQLGISLGAAVKSLADLNGDLDGSDGSAAAADVLLAFAGSSAPVAGSEGRGVDGGEPRPRPRRRTG